MSVHRRKICLKVLFFIIAILLACPVNIHADTDSIYRLEVNAKANVVTVYKKADGLWEPYRAMRCSTGIGDGDTKTPTGTYYVKGRWDWGAMVGNVYARYCVHFYSDYLFHSVPYNERYNKKSQPTKEFNKLGEDASHGCVRLSTMDAKWVYDHCGRGTEVVIYNSSNPGPLGKPPAITVSTSRETYWDPTDPDNENPYYKLQNPIISISKKKALVVDKGSQYSLTSGVTAQNPNTFQDLTRLLTVSNVEWYSTEKKSYVKKSFSTSRLGMYRITYKVNDPYSGISTKTIKIKVADILSAPNVSIGNDKDTGYVKLTWKPIKNAASYQVYRAEDPDGPYYRRCTLSETTYINNYSAVAGKKYYYKVRALPEDETYEISPFSEVKYRICDLPRPVITPSNDSDTGYVKLTWKPIENAVSYQVYRAEDPDGPYYRRCTLSETTYINNYSAVAGKRYYYKVRAIHKNNSYADSSLSKWRSRVCDLPRPIVKAQKNSTTGAITLSWKSIKGASSYKIYRAAERNGTYKSIATIKGSTFIDTPIPNTTPVYYKVRAISSSTSDANSSYSKIVTLK